MDADNIIKHLNKYENDTESIYTGFRSFAEAVAFANDRKGELIELGFLDGNDNPVKDSSANLIADKKHYKAFSGKDYTILHSSDEGFQAIADKLKERQTELTDKSIDEQYFSDADWQIKEDAVIVLYKDEVANVTSRERSKYLMHTKVYEIAVCIPKKIN